MRQKRIIGALLALTVTATTLQLPQVVRAAAPDMRPEAVIETGQLKQNQFGTYDLPEEAVSQEDIDHAKKQLYGQASVYSAKLRSTKDALSANPNADDGRFVVAIDAGHGGTDSGAVGGDLKEKNLNLTIAKYVKQYLEEYRDVEVYMTRTKDTYVGLYDRVKNAVDNGADVFISLHNNSAGNTGANGAMVFYPNDSHSKSIHQEGKALAQSIQNKLVDLGLYNRGIQIRNSESGNRYADGKLADYYSVIYNSKNNGIAGLIVEHAFLSNEQDRKNYLSSTAKLQKLALADAQGIAEYYGLQYEDLEKPQIAVWAPDHQSIRVSSIEQDGADGYVLYRSETETGGYKRVADLALPEYKDTDVKQGKTYYYKMRAYAVQGKKRYYTKASKAQGAYTIGGTEIKTIKQTLEGNIKIVWKKFTDGDGFVVYRKEAGGSYKKLATLDNPKATSYTDTRVKDASTYQYKVKPLHYSNEIQGYGKSSKAVAVTKVPVPEITDLSARDDGTVLVKWKAATGASKLLLQRADSPEGEFKTIATITDQQKKSYKDKNVLVGPEYIYRTIAYNENGIVIGDTGYTTPQAISNFQGVILEKVKLLNSGNGIKLSWSKSAKAQGYIIYRSNQPDSGFKRLVKVKGEDTTTYTDQISAEIGQSYYYRVKGYITHNKKSYYTDLSDVLGAVAGTSIMGKANTTVEQMVSFYQKRGGEYPNTVYAKYGAATLKAFCQIVYNEAVAEGVRPEVVFAQICKETGFLRFGGDVSPEQCNFAGIGATGGGVPGNSFPNVQTGIRAQVQHLKAYASDEALINECVDPRFQYVKRKTAVYVEWLGIQENPNGGGWAAGVNYGYSLRDDYLKPLLSS